MQITSARNPVVKYVRSLERTAIRREEGVFLAEGVRLVGEALATGQRATLVLYDPDLLQRTTAGSLLLSKLSDWAEHSYEVKEHVLAAAAQTEHPAGVLAVVRIPQPPSLDTFGAARCGLMLDRIADPGNAGTILRTSAAVGVDFVVAMPGTVDLFAPKVVRAGMGAHFRLPIYVGFGWDKLDMALPGRTTMAIEAQGMESLYSVQWPQRMNLVLGSEAHGLSPESQARSRRSVRIPMYPGVESLNASVAAAVALYTALGPEIPDDIQQEQRYT